MRKLFWLCCLFLLCAPFAAAQEAAAELTPQELAVIEAIKAKNRAEQEAAPAAPSAPEAQTAPMQAPPPPAQEEQAGSDIKLSEHAKQQAWEEQKQTEQAQDAAPTAPAQTADEPEQEADEPEEQAAAPDKKCLVVAFIDIDIAFNEHPRTQAVKQQIDLKIKAKQREVENARDIIAALEAENRLLTRQLAELKPFYERIVVDQMLLPKVPESADTLLLGNTINRLLFSGCERLSTTPLNSPARLDDLTERVGANKKIIAERSFFIDNYKYQTREEILKLEQEEVKAILQDIYTEIKSFAKKRNIGAVVRKDEILYGQQPVNVTKDFVSRLKKSKKYRKK